MTPIELIFNMLGEQDTIDEKKDKEAQSYKENLEAAMEGSKKAGTATEAFEKAKDEHNIARNMLRYLM
jgi:hypothetical protein